MQRGEQTHLFATHTAASRQTRKRRPIRPALVLRTSSRREADH